MRPALSTIVVACAAAALVIAVGVAARPLVPSLSEEESGDPGLLAHVRPLLSEGVHDRVGVVEIDGEHTRFAHFGADDQSTPPDYVQAHRDAWPDAVVHVYPGAGHAFNRDVDPRHFHPESAALARRRSLDFLASVLG